MDKKRELDLETKKVDQKAMKEAAAIGKMADKKMWGSYLFALNQTAGVSVKTIEQNDQTIYERQ